MPRRASRWLAITALAMAAYEPLAAQDSVTVHDTTALVTDSITNPVADTAAPLPPRPPAPRTAVRLAFTGDINLGTTTLPDALPPDSGRTLFAAVDSLLVGDRVIGNFEGVLADTGISPKCKPHSKMCYAFSTPTWLAVRLVEAGFTDLNLANNHANDMGLAARLASDSVLRSLGLRTYGPLGQFDIDTITRGDSITVIGIVGFTTYPFANNLLDIPASVALVDSLRPLVDILVVTFHGGAEGAEAQHVPYGPEELGKEPRGDLRNWAHAVVDAGANIVVGHGPHVLRGMEFYRGTLIAYSLGNFATYKGFNLTGPNGLTTVLQVELGPDGGFAGGRAVPLVQLPRMGPEPDPAGRAAALIGQLSSADFGPTAAGIAADGEITPP
jgi:hypothetical protein